jgi:hypothetical protein
MASASAMVGRDARNARIAAGRTPDERIVFGVHGDWQSKSGGLTQPVVERPIVGAWKLLEP